MAKFAMVGGIGIAVNLIALVIIQGATGTRVWWTSAAANFIATLHNYVVNNLWTVRDRQQRGMAWLKACLVYFGVASISSIILIPFCYSEFNHYARHLMRQVTGFVAAWVALLSQLLAIIVGTSFNYLLNKTITWRLDTTPIE